MIRLICKFENTDLEDMQKMVINHALISVFDKTSIVDFAKVLNQLGIDIIATQGTLDRLKKGGVQLVKHVSEITHFPEILDGRVKTEHPKLIGGILALRTNEEHVNQLKRLEIQTIDMVVCNIYPVEMLINRQFDTTKILENIDIGGPNLIRAAAKNFKEVVVIVNPKKYDQVLQELKKEGDISIKTRFMLAMDALKETAEYDYAIYTWLKNHHKR